MDLQRINQLKLPNTIKGRISHLIRYSNMTDDEKNELIGIFEVLTTGNEQRNAESHFSVIPKK